MKPTLLAAIAATLFATSASAEDTAIQVENPYVFETARMAKAGGGFVTLTNTGDGPDTLLEVRADVPKVEIHRTLMQDGRAMMRPAGAIEIGAGETVSLEPGGLHIMFMGLPDPFELGETVPVTLVFEHAGEVEIDMPVVKRVVQGHDTMGHGAGHGHGNGGNN